MLRKTVNQFPHSRPYLIVTAIAVAIYFPTWAMLASKWLEFDQVLAHGLATALIYLGVLVVHPPIPKKQPDPTSRPHSLAGAVFLVSTTLIWSLLVLVRIDTLAFLMLPVGLAAVSWALLGFGRTKVFLPYILLVSLSLPIWADLVPALVSLASGVVGTWVRWLGMPALIEGNSITLPYGRILIADGCSGIRYFAISILLGMMTSILNDYRWKGWVATVAFITAMGLLANWVRITILVVVAYETNMQSELLVDHEVMGWIVFGVFLFPALYFAPVRRRDAQGVRAAHGPRMQKAGAVAVLAAIAVGPVALMLSQSSVRANPAWTLSTAELEPRKNQTLPLPITLPGTLAEEVWNSGGIWISLAQTQKQEPADKLVPYLPPLYDDSTWQVVEKLEPGLKLYRNILTREQVLMGQWYQVGSRKTWSYHKAKLLQIPATLGGETRFALVTLQLPCGERDCQAAAGRLKTEMTEVGQNLEPRG